MVALTFPHCLHWSIHSQMAPRRVKIMIWCIILSRLERAKLCRFFNKIKEIDGKLGVFLLCSRVIDRSAPILISKQHLCRAETSANVPFAFWWGALKLWSSYFQNRKMAGHWRAGVGMRVTLSTWCEAKDVIKERDEFKKNRRMWGWWKIYQCIDVRDCLLLQKLTR
jgi:hypothetical protein